jgi:hypothetical protein
MLKFTFKKTRVSRLAEDSRVRLSVNILPQVLKTRSESTLVTGAER